MVFLPNWPKIALWPKNQTYNHFSANKLERCQLILDKIGFREEQLPPTIHIAGTNGKGSTLAIIEAIFQQKGYLIHKYSSPHLLAFNERIKLKGQAISDAHLDDILMQTKQACELLGCEPGFFEGTTIAAFLAFAKIKADILLLETGMGGRLDPTNILSKPLLTIITPISYDHMEYLGNDLPQIATEKAGIIKPGIPCIIAKQENSALYDLLLTRCDQVGAPSFCYEYDFTSKADANHFKFISKNIETTLPLPSLPGQHQIINASTALAAIFLLNEQLQISQQQIKQGLANITWPGRLEQVSSNQAEKLADANTDIFLDGAHNEAGANILAIWLKEQMAKNIYSDIYLILGLTNNRSVSKFCQNFKSLVTEIITVTVQSEPASYHAQTLKEQLVKEDFKAYAAISLPEAIKSIASENKSKAAIGQQQTKRKLILVTGSLFLLTDFYQLLTIS